MAVTARVIKYGCGYQYQFKRVELDYLDIMAETKEELFALFFREYDNRYKYCDDIFYQLSDQQLRNEYRLWISDIRNYANNGGNML